MRLDRVLPDARQPLGRLKHYRDRAKELRIIADEWMDSGTREVLMRVAQQYEHMAERLEKQLGSVQQGR